MTARRIARHLPVAVATFLVLMLATAAAAREASDRLALQLTYRGHGHGKKDSAQSFSRHVATHLVPLLEGLGYEVTRVKNAQKAIRSGDFHVSLALDVDAKPMWLVHEARQYHKTVVHDSEPGVTAWAEWKIFGWRKQKQIAEGKLGPMDSRVHDFPRGGRPLMDDEESVARVFAGEIADTAGEVFRDYDAPEDVPWAEDE